MQLLQQIWNGILDFTKLLVIPDWGSLIALLPVFTGVIVVVFFAYVDVPGPAFRPILAALGTFVLFAGLVFGGWVLAVGVIFVIVSLLGWLTDARKEYGQVVRADATGHLENQPPPGWPKVVVPVFAVLVVVAVALNAGWFPPRSAVGGGAA